MEFTTVLFYVFAAILIFAAARVITDRNPVHAALYLVLAFFSAASLWMLIKAEFLSIVLVLVYVGAVMVLFLFVVMMVDINFGKIREGFWSYFPLAATVGVVIVLEMAAVLFRGFWKAQTVLPENAAMIGNTKELGKLIYTDYVYAFELAAMLLLVAMIAAVALTLRKRKDSKYFAPGDAVRVKAADRVRVVKMKAESVRSDGDQPSAAPAAEQK
jgi:NADH-quinone oxidoreductase subunit J